MMLDVMEGENNLEPQVGRGMPMPMRHSDIWLDGLTKTIEAMELSIIRLIGGRQVGEKWSDISQLFTLMEIEGDLLMQFMNSTTPY